MKTKVADKWCNITNALIAKYKLATEKAETEAELNKIYEELIVLEHILDVNNIIHKV